MRLNTERARRLPLSILLAAFVGFSGASAATDDPTTPHQIIQDLRQEMYVIGESGARPDAFDAAEKTAALAVRQFVDRRNDDRLTELNASGQTPLNEAASVGFSRIVHELLASAAVREEIDLPDANGVSPWIVSNLALMQTRWTCAPTTFQDPTRLVPFLVVQPFYASPSASPYLRTRELLAESGARTNMNDVKSAWKKFCRTADASLATTVGASDDVLVTLLAESKSSMDRFLSARRR